MAALAPVHNPLFNLEQCVKQCLLLEQHLFEPDKRCHDCITKHLYMVEALLEEAFSLDKQNHHGAAINPFLQAIRQIRSNYHSAKDYPQTGQFIRRFRKPLMHYVSSRGPISR